MFALFGGNTTITAQNIDFLEKTLLEVGASHPETSLRAAFGHQGCLADPAMASMGPVQPPRDSLLSRADYNEVSRIIRWSPNWQALDSGMYDDDPVLVLNEQTVSAACEALRQGSKSWGEHLVQA